MSKAISWDTECYYDDEVSLKPLGYWKYARHPRCEKYMISVCDGKEVWVGHPKNFNFDSLNGVTLISHNQGFDQEIALAAIEQNEWPVFKPAKWVCSANMSAYLWNARSLKDAAKAGLGVEVSKGVRDRAKGKRWLDMVTEGWSGEMLSYAASDAQHPWYLWDKYNHLWPEFERRLSTLTIESGRYGVRIDVPALQEGIALLGRVIFKAQQNLPWIARGRKPGSPIGIAEECRSNNIPCPPVKADDPDAAEAWEEEHAPRFPFVRALKDTRKAKKMLATLETIQRRLRDDETVATSLKYCGASTRRWSGDQNHNLQNPNREPLFINESLSFLYDKFEIAKLVKEFKSQKEAVGLLPSGVTFIDLRGLIIPRAGKKIAPVDLSQIEPRVLNWLAGNEKLLEMLRQGLGIYEAFARSSLGWTGGKLKTENESLYALAKADVLGLGYGAAWEKFITVAWTLANVDITVGDEEFALKMAIDGRTHRRVKVLKEWIYESTPEGVEAVLGIPSLFTDASPRCVFVRKQKKDRRGNVTEVVVPLQVYGMRSRVTVEEFRRTNPLVVALWKKLDDAFKAALGGDLTLELPNGDKLVYRDIRKGRRKRIDPDTGEEYEQNVYTALVGGRRKSFYGSMLAENITQTTSRHAFGENLLTLDEVLSAEDPTQRILWTAHDEAITEINNPGDAPEAIAAAKHRLESIMSVTPSWLAGCYLGAEAKILHRYGK